MEMLLVMGVGVLIASLAFALGNKQIQKSKVDEAVQRLVQISGRINSVMSGNLNYAVLAVNPTHVIPKDQYDEAGNLRGSPWGPVDVTVNGAGNEYYVVRFSSVSSQGCVGLATKGFDGFWKVDVNGSTVWTGTDPAPDPGAVAMACAMNSLNTVDFYSRTMSGSMPVAPPAPACVAPQVLNVSTNTCMIPSVPTPPVCASPNVSNPYNGACCSPPAIYASPLTGLCEALPSCPAPKVIVPSSGACENVLVCLGNQVLNPTTNRCGCPLTTGMTLNASTGYCDCDVGNWNGGTGSCETVTPPTGPTPTGGYWGIVYSHCEGHMPRPAGNWVAKNTAYELCTEGGSRCASVPPPPYMFATGAFAILAWSGPALPPADPSIAWAQGENATSFTNYCKDLAPAAPANCAAGSLTAGGMTVNYPAMSHAGMESISAFRDSGGLCKEMSVGCNNGSVVRYEPAYNPALNCPP